MSEADAAPRGRGSAENPPNRFDRLHYERDPDVDDEEQPAPATQYLRDATRSIIARNNSPDVGFDVSINPYRGCEHGCAYCYARPTHEFLGFSAGLDFESKILVKEDAPILLRRELSSRRWQPQPLALSGVTDCYQPIERRLQLTRRCLQVLAEFRNPAVIITKNQLVTRDIDVLQELARFQAVLVILSVTSLNGDLSRVLEPRASQPRSRLDALEKLCQAGIPTGVLVAPIIPGLTDHEVPSIITEVARRGACFGGYTLVRLPLAVRPLFEHWLGRHFPDKKERVLGRLRSMRNGKLNDPRFGSRMAGEGPLARVIERLFDIACKKTGLSRSGPELSTAAFRRPQGEQRQLFD
jgi:DNA repair photolyase